MAFQVFIRERRPPVGPSDSLLPLETAQETDSWLELNLQHNRRRILDSGKIRKRAEIAKRLTPTERGELLELLHRKYPKGEAPEYLLLLLGDRAAWNRFFDLSLSQNGIVALPMLSEYGSVVEDLSAPLKEELFAKIASSYPYATKGSDGPWRHRYHPKRVLDSWLRRLLPVESLVKEAKAKKLNVLQTYQLYLDEIDQKIVRREKLLQANPRLSADDVFGICREIQQALKDGGYKGAELRFFGSVVKGLARPGSDLDLLGRLTSNARDTGGSLRSVDGRMISAKDLISERVNRFLSKRGIRLKLGIDRIHTDVNELETLSCDPFMFRITPQEVELEAYSAKVLPNPLVTSIQSRERIPELTVETYRTGRVISLGKLGKNTCTPGSISRSLRNALGSAARDPSR